MSFFCGKTCQCRNRCDADLAWNKEAKKGCRQACNTANPPTNGYAWLASQPANVQALYNYKPNQAAATEPGAPGSGGDGGDDGSGGGLSTGVILLMVAAAVALFLIIRAKRK